MITKLPFFTWLLVLPFSLQAQLFYNSTKDAKGQQALQAAKEVTSGEVFDKMTDNLDRMSTASNERFFNDAERLMRANKDAFRTWNDIAVFTKKLEGRLQLDEPGDSTPAEIADSMQAVADETKKAQAALQALQGAAKSKFPAPAEVALIGTWFARLGDLSDFINFAEQFTPVQEVRPGFVSAAKEAASLAAALGKMYAGFTVALAKTPDMVILETQLDLLAANEDHLKQLAKILTQREIDLADTRHLIRQVNQQIDAIGDGGQEIAKSIDAQLADPSAEPKKVETMIFVLYNAAALASRDTAPKRLASLRLAEEEHRYSVRKSAVQARSYEALVGTGVERLANYYKGGIKVETLAQITSALSTLGLIPTIAVK